MNGQIEAKKLEIKAAKADLNMLENAGTEAPEYIRSLEEASADGLDMIQWISDNPPPENLSQYLEDY